MSGSEEKSVWKGLRLADVLHSGCLSSLAEKYGESGRRDKGQDNSRTGLPR